MDECAFEAHSILLILYLVFLYGDTPFQDLGCTCICHNLLNSCVHLMVCVCAPLCTHVNHMGISTYMCANNSQSLITTGIILKPETVNLVQREFHDLLSYLGY